MRFDPNIQDEEQKEYPLPAPGKYRFGVGYSADKVSKAGNEQVQLKLDLLDANGTVIGEVWDYLGALPWRVVQFCKSAGMTQCLASGTMVAADCKDRRGWCEVEHKTSEKYGVQASVKKYLYKKEAPANAAPSTATASDDDIPF